MRYCRKLLRPSSPEVIAVNAIQKSNVFVNPGSLIRRKQPKRIGERVTDQVNAIETLQPLSLVSSVAIHGWEILESRLFSASNARWVV